MNISTFLNFLFLLIFKHKSKHIPVFFISIILVFIISSVIFIKTALKHDTLTTLEVQSDFTVQKISSGVGVDTPENWADEFLEIQGITNVNQRVYGKYWYEPNEKYFFIIGIDLFEEQTAKDLQNIVKNIDITKFLSKNFMIIGEGVRRHFDDYKYTNYYNFRPPDRSINKIFIYDVLPKELNTISNDVVFMKKSLAKEILGIEDDECTDIVLNAPNSLEHDIIKTKLILKHFNMRIVKKDDIKKAYENLFNYKGGIFLIFYLIALITFALILYQRYTMISSVDKKEIGILKAVGWSIKDIIFLKLSENFIVAIFAFLIGFIFAFIFVFILNAPILIDIFLGSENLAHQVLLEPYISINTFFMLFVFFVVPFISSILIPVWKIAILDITKSIK